MKSSCINQLELEVQRLQYENEQKTIEMNEMKTLLNSKQVEIEVQNRKIEAFEKERSNLEDQAAEVKNIFRHVDIEPIYEQVVELFAQFYPDEENIGDFLVQQHGDASWIKEDALEQSTVKSGMELTLPEISKSISFATTVKSPLRPATPPATSHSIRSSFTFPGSILSRLDTQTSILNEGNRFTEVIVPQEEKYFSNITNERTKVSVGVQATEPWKAPSRSLLNSSKDRTTLDPFRKASNSPSATSAFLSQILERHTSNKKPMLSKNRVKSKTSLGFNEGEGKSSPQRMRRYGTPPPQPIIKNLRMDLSPIYRNLSP